MFGNCHIETTHTLYSETLDSLRHVLRHQDLQKGLLVNDMNMAEEPKIPHEHKDPSN